MAINYYRHKYLVSAAHFPHNTLNNVHNNDAYFALTFPIKLILLHTKFINVHINICQRSAG